VVYSPIVTRTVPPLEIGTLSIWPPIVLAPMSGVTNRTLRALYKPFGFGLTVTEFVSSNALTYGSKRTMEMIDQHGIERPVSTQLWGNDPEVMAQAAKVVRECGADIVDINFGCPAPKVTKTEGGSACLRDVARCEAIMRAVVAAVDCPVTVKMRLGWNETDLVFIDVARRAEAVGVRAVTLHARTAKQFYKGSADWARIAELKAAVGIPVIGNGDLGDAHTAFARMRETGVDAVMLGRSTLGNPWLVDGLRALMEGREPKPYPHAADRLRFAVEHYHAMVGEWGEPRAVPQMRKHLGYYLKGFAGASALRERLMRTETAAETLAIVNATIATLDAPVRELAVA
jgi:tRNA-dihydrouridine synthase B